MKFIKESLPDTDPYIVALQVDLNDRTGRRHQLDAVVLGYHALYVVEVKSHPGKLDGDHADWRITFPNGTTTVFDNPLRATAHKAKVLASLLEALIPDRSQRPWVEPLVFLSSPELEVRLKEQYRGGVVTRRDFARAITFGEVPLAQERLSRRLVNRPTMRAVAEALKKVLSKSEAGLAWGELQLREVIDEQAGYQDWRAEHSAIAEMVRRVRVYPNAPSATAEQRDQLARAARREADLLTYLDHRSILRAFDYQPNGPTGAPAVAFDGFKNAEKLESFVRRNPGLSFAHKVEMIEALAEGLAYCHGKRVFHRGLHPGAVLVRQVAPGATPELKIYNFQLATRADTSLGTTHLSAFSTDPTLLYRAPEAIERPEQAGTVGADLFSLGAIAYFVLTGRHPGSTLPERHALLGDRGLSVAAANDALAGRPDAEEVKSLDEVVAFATDPSPITRADNVQEWINLFLEAASSPAKHDEEARANPLEAGKGDELGEGLVVEALLGSGSTARVLRVRRGEQTFALKVPLSPEVEGRLVAEADALRKAKCDRIVTLEGEPILEGRHCLLLGYAGDTLAALMSRDGPQSLDYGRRWGEDLLYALSVLEERGVFHRDVKPANLGVLAGESKKARHLFLFDFSLAGADPTRIELGTPAYRDPFLASRPGARWDASSDRYSAAVTLHELLTGMLPRYGTGETAAVATDEKVTLAVERFDAAVRDRLVAFFEKALDRDVARRHESAEAMRTHWQACFGPAHAGAEAGPPALDDAALAALPLDTPIPALPLSPSAKNALDRSGLVLARELSSLPRNQLSSIRGVGRGTVKEILAFVERYQRLKTADEETPVPMWPGYRGADGAVALALEAAPAVALEDAGLGRIHAVAGADKGRVERILGRFPGAREALGAHLEREQKLATGTPATVEGYLDLFLPPARGSKAPAWAKQVRAFYGLDALPGAMAGDARSLASVLGVSRQAIYVSVARGREKWQSRPEQLTALRGLVEGALSSQGEVAPLERLARALTTALPHEPGQESDPAALVRAEALVRICAETAGAGEVGEVVLERVGPVLWAGASAAHLQAARALGAAADELAQQDPLASAAEVERRLAEVVRGTPVGELPADRMLAVAAEASEKAARSARLELYPKGMKAERALQLCAGALGGEIAVEEVRRLVSSRYPEAEALPERPALDDLLAGLKLGWNQARERYVRAELARVPTRTEALSGRKATVALPPARKELSQEALEAEGFDETLRLTVQKRLFKVLDVSRAYAEDAAKQLEARLHVQPRSLERELLDIAWGLMREMKIDEAVVLDADKAGPRGPTWMNLVKLMQLAAERLASRLLAEKEPVILKDPGIAARYELDALLEKLVRAAQDDQAPAIMLLNPVVAEGGPQDIDAVTKPMSIPTTAPAQRVTIPASWIKNDLWSKA